jgi:O-antigen ligase
MNGYVIFAHPEYEIIRHSENKRNDKKEINGKVRQNSLFRPVLNIPFFDSESKLASPRIKRWLFAWEIFRDYSFTQKLIGNGFEYLELYNEKFYPNKDKIDYPHNPIISSFLYSGIIGGLVYIWFLLTSLYYYYKYRKEFGLLFILYLVTGFFIFFSYNSHFSIPAFSMLSVVPFVINYYKKEIENNDRTT